MAEFIHDNQVLYYETAGVSDMTIHTPILMLHGNGENLRIFDRVVSPLFSARSFVLMDSRTQGRSYALQAGSRRLSYEAMASDALALMEHLSIPEYDVVGYSDGGIIALIMAMRSRRVRKLITIGANTDPSGLTRRALHDIRAEQRLAINSGDDETAELMRLMLEEPHITSGDLAGIIAEATIVLGRRDPMIKRRHSELIADAIPRASHIYIDGAGHDIPATHPVVLSDLIRTVL